MGNSRADHGLMVSVHHIRAVGLGMEEVETELAGELVAVNGLAAMGLAVNGADNAVALIGDDVGGSAQEGDLLRAGNPVDVQERLGIGGGHRLHIQMVAGGLDDQVEGLAGVDIGKPHVMPADQAEVAEELVFLGLEPVQIVDPTAGRGGGSGALLGGSIDGIDLVDGLAAGNAVGIEAVFLLEGLDGGSGFIAGIAGYLAGVEAQFSQFSLNLLDRGAAQVGIRGCGGLGGFFSAGSHFIQVFEGFAADDAVCGETVLFLEGLDGSGGLAADVSGHIAGVHAQILELLLHVTHGAGIGGTGRGSGHLRRCRHLSLGDFIQLFEGFATDDAVRRKAVLFLESLDGSDGFLPCVAGDAAGVHAQVLELLLHVAHRSGADGAGHGRGGGGSGHLFRSDFIQFGEGCISDDAVRGEAVLFLEGLDGGCGLCADVAGHLAGIDAQVLELLLHVTHGIGADGAGHGRSSGGRGSLFRSDFIQFGKGCISDDAVRGEAVLFLEGLDGGGGLIADVAGHLAGIDAQVLELLLHVAHGVGVHGTHRGRCGLG